MKTKNSKYRFLIFVMIGMCLLCAMLLNLSNKGYFIDKGEPMLKEDVRHLCKKLDMEKETICNNDEKKYPKDFSLYISDRFESNSSTYQDVQDALGRFQTKLDENLNLNVFVSHYDINRDNITDLSIYFGGTLTDNVLNVIVFSEDVGF